MFGAKPLFKPEMTKFTDTYELDNVYGDCIDDTLSHLLQSRSILAQAIERVKTTSKEKKVPWYLV